MPATKRFHSQMESSGLTEVPDVSSTLTVAPLLKRGQRPDAELSTKIFQEIDEKTKGCWTLGVVANEQHHKQPQI